VSSNRYPLDICQISSGSSANPNRISGRCPLEIVSISVLSAKAFIGDDPDRCSKNGLALSLDGDHCRAVGSFRNAYLAFGRAGCGTFNSSRWTDSCSSAASSPARLDRCQRAESDPWLPICGRLSLGASKPRNETARLRGGPHVRPGPGNDHRLAS
jgi:hypothetical protein